MLKKIRLKQQKLKLFQFKVTSLFLGALGVFAVTFVSFFLYYQVQSIKAIENILPTQDLVLLTEFSKKDFPEIISENPYFKQIFLETNLQKYLNQSIGQFKIGTSDWLGDQIGFALYKKSPQAKDFNYYIFLKSLDDKKALNFLTELGLQGEELKTEEYLNLKIISFSQSLNLNCSFMYGYFVCSNNKESLQKLIDFNQNELGYLSLFEPYNKVKNNLPKNSVGKIYLNIQNIDFQNLEFYLGPLKEYLQEMGVSLSRFKNGIKLNSYLALEKGLVDSGSVVLKNDLSQSITGENNLIYVEGENLTQSIQQLFQIWDEITPNFSVIIESLLRAKIKQYFSDEVTLEDDFYPLLQNQYAFSLHLEEISSLPHFSLVFNLTEKEKTEKIMERLAEGFYQMAGQYLPVVKKTILPDGTEVEELVADDSRVERTSKTIGKITLNLITIQNFPYDFAYAFTENKLFIATNKDVLAKNLDLILNPQNSFAYTPIYLSLEEVFSLKGTEFSFVNLKKVLPLLTTFNSSSVTLELFSIFDYMAVSTKWFDDGMANEVIFLQEESI